MTGPTIALSDEEWGCRHRFIDIVDGPLTEPFRCILQQMIRRKDPTENIVEYFEREPPVNPPSKKKVKDKICRTDWQTINDDKLCQHFDITLAHKCILLYSDDVKDENAVDPDTIEDYLKNIKNHRNNIFHATTLEQILDKKTFEEKVAEIRTLLQDTWRKISVIYKIGTSAEIKKMQDDIKEIKMKPLHDIKKELLEAKELLEKRGIPSMKRKYLEYLPNAPDMEIFASTPDKRRLIPVIDVFTEMHTVSKQGGKDKEVKFPDWLTLMEKEHGKTHVSKFILVDGVAGIGKTTITTKMILEWASDKCTMNHFGSYEVVIYMQFREKTMSSLNMFCLHSMPDITDKVRPGYMMSIMKGKSIMFVCDGLDEHNESSYSIFQEILEYGKKNCICIICTTRPEQIANINHDLPIQYSCLRIKILGIPDGLRGTFVSKYYSKVQPDKTPEQLLHYLMESARHLEDHWRFPFNLVSLVLLHVEKSDCFEKLETATDLFLAMNDMLKEKLIHRRSGTAKAMDLKDWANKLSDFLSTIYEIALSTHEAGEIVISDDSIEKLEVRCCSLGMDKGTTISTFLTQYVSWSDVNDYSYSFPHKGLQDFYAALGVMARLEYGSQSKEQIVSEVEDVLKKHDWLSAENQSLLNGLQNPNALNEPQSIRRILEGITQGSGTASKKIERSQNLLVHVCGLMYRKEKMLTDKMANELIDLLEESGLTEEDQWLDLLQISHCHSIICRLIAEKIKFGSQISISDARVASYESLLPHVKRVFEFIDIQIKSYVANVPRFPQLMKELEKKGKTFGIYFEDDFRNPKTGGSSLEGVPKNIRCKINKFRGNAGDLSLLPNRMDYLSLSFANDVQARRVIAQLEEPGRKIRELVEVARNIGGGWRGDDGKGERGFWRVFFPRSRMNRAGVERLIDGFRSFGVKIYGALGVSSNNLKGEDQDHLSRYARKKIGCHFYLWDDEWIWP